MKGYSVYKIKDRQGHGSLHVLSLTDNIKAYDGLDQSVIIFDQKNEIGHSISYNNSPYSKKNNTMEVESFEFSSIATITSYMSMSDVVTMLDKLIQEEVISDDDKKNILDNLKISYK